MSDNGWVSVKDQLPGYDHRVLIFSGHSVGIASYDPDGWWTDEYRKIKPTHWRELPPPPEAL